MAPENCRKKRVAGGWGEQKQEQEQEQQEQEQQQQQQHIALQGEAATTEAPAVAREQSQGGEEVVVAALRAEVARLKAALEAAKAH